MSTLLETQWLDYCMDRAYDAGWIIAFGVRHTAVKSNIYGTGAPRKEFWVQLVDREGKNVTKSFSGITLDSAAFALVQSVWTPAQDKAEETA